MKTGDLLTDGSGRSWTVGQLLGRGSWGRTWSARDDTGREGALKEPLTTADLPADLAGAEALAAVCRDAAQQSADLLEKGLSPAAPRLDGRIQLPGGAIAVITPRYPTTLARKLEAGASLDEILDVLVRVVMRLGESPRPHGNLRPTNIFLSERGEVVLGDPLVPALAGSWSRLSSALGDREGWRPPEARDTAASAGWDTWAACAAVYQAVLARTISGDRRPARAAVPNRGIDRVELAALKDRALARLAESGTRSNPRFRSRLADRLGSLLNRGLSLAFDPSPPYRFESAAALQPRLDEVASLVAPQVTEVGRLLPGGGTTEGVFRSGEPVSFAVTVACTPGITDHEDLACGLQLADLDAEDRRIPLGEAKFALKTHPSGRLRFEFTLPEVPPGRYRLRAAFSMRESGDDPRLAEVAFQVRPPPGWVPPARDTAPAPIALPTSALPEPQSTAQTEADAPSGPGAEIIDGLFPRPVAPPPEDSDIFSVRAEPPTRTAADATSSVPQLRLTPRLVAVEVDATDSEDASEGSEADEEAPPLPPPRPTAPQIRLEPLLSSPSSPPAYPAAIAPGVLRGPGRWEEAPDEDEQLIGGGLPGRGGEDLPDLGGRFDNDEPIRGLDRLMMAIRRDSRIAIGGAIGASLLLILITMAGLKAC